MEVYIPVIPLWIALALFFGYAVGNLQFAYFLGKIIGRIDIREHGSGTAGMTNVMRVMGAKAGLAVLVLDVSKTIFAIFVTNRFLMYLGWDLSINMLGMEYFYGMLTGLGVILGHNFPFYLKFKGGKGVASSISLALMFDWRVLVITLIIAIIILIITKYMSAASLVGFAAFAITTTVLFSDIKIVLIAWIIAVLGYFTHRKNIARLLTGTESKFAPKWEKNSTD